MLHHFISRPTHRPSLDGGYRVASPTPKPTAPEPKRCASTDCATPAKSGCGGYCTRCWQERRARVY